MIQMKVKLVKLKTDDGRFDYSALGEENVGKEFWVLINSVSIQKLRERFTGNVFEAIMVKSEDAAGGKFVPVELLEFINEFKK